MSKVSKISELTKMVKNDITTHFLRKRIINFEKWAIYVKSIKNIKSFPSGKK